MSATIIKSDVLALPGLSTQLSTMSDAAWVMLLAVVNTWDLEQTGEGEDITKLLRVYLCAHFALMDVRAQTGAAGPVTAESAGQLRRSYGLLAQAAGANSLAGTLYGQMALTLIGASAAHGPMLV